VFLAEALGAGIIVYAVLCLKANMVRGSDIYMYPIGYTVVSIGCNQLFRGVSGGVFNPALALAEICWQNLTYYYEPGGDQPYWTPDFAVSYIMAPFVGAFFAANMYNFQKLI
jgi:glycerol uptake facilitator-like aquaporin